MKTPDPQSRLEFTLNGEKRTVETDRERTLLELLREDLQLTGTKYGCGEGQCRACTVLLDGEPTPSCLTPVSFVAGKSVVTIEGLASDEELHPVQAAFVDADAMQCGYCAPGMILTAVAFLRRHRAPDRAAIARGMNGNLCRCCGYSRILDAVEMAAGRRETGDRK